MPISRVYAAFLETPWAITEAKFAEIEAFLEQWLGLDVAGDTFPERAVQPRPHFVTAPDADGLIDGYQAAAADPARGAGQVAILPLFGTIVPRANLMTEFSGGTSVQKFTAQLRQALADPNVGSILIDVDSPGGAVPGVQELADEIYRARSQKRIVASVNSTMASAAYWIGSAAEEIAMIPSGTAGSIGVFTAHRDISGAEEKAGIKTTLISAGKDKVLGNPYEPLSDRAREVIQARVDEFYDAFVKTVARNRGVGVAAVRNGMGTGRSVGAKEALAEKMIDRTETFDATLSRLVGGRGRRSGAQAEGVAGADPVIADAAPDLAAADPAADAEHVAASAAAELDLRRRRARMLAHE